ncbi:MAG: hypothetical protein JWN04_2907 [Myxococcaceae bacterium]|nr:hypothetical protein [Myxococcaceae bacterium]
MSQNLTEPLQGSIPFEQPRGSLPSAYPHAVGERDLAAIEVRQAVARIAAEAAGLPLDAILAYAAKRRTGASGEGIDGACLEELTRAGEPRVSEPRVGAPGRMAALRAQEGAALAPARSLVRQQRQALLFRKRRDLDAIAQRYTRATDLEKGVWSRENFRRIRAGVQDASGRAAECLLYMLGTTEAAELARGLEPRVPMDRRLIAFYYALATAPGNKHFQKMKMGLPLGLFSGALADPNNVNMKRERRFRPTRRTLYSDLVRLDSMVALSRWQVPVDVAEPCEMKRGATHPTNRYWVSSSRDGHSMMEIALALGDVAPAFQVDPSEPWSRDDAAALAELAGRLDPARPASSPPGSG